MESVEKAPKSKDKKYFFNKKTEVGVTLGPELYRWLRDRGQTTGMTLSACIASILLKEYKEEIGEEYRKELLKRLDIELTDGREPSAIEKEVS